MQFAESVINPGIEEEVKGDPIRDDEESDGDEVDEDEEQRN